MSLQHGMSAGDARKLGHDVPDNVPDCASFELVKMDVGDVTQNDQGVVLMSLTMHGYWRWLTFVAEIDVCGHCAGTGIVGEPCPKCDKIAPGGDYRLGEGKP